MRRTVLAALLCAVVGGTSAGTGGVDLEKYLKPESFSNVKLSPGGEYVAGTVPLDDSTALVILRTSDRKPAGVFRPQDKNHANTFEWVSNERLLVGLAEKLGALDTPQPTGELYGVNVDGKGGELLVGYRVQGRGLGTRIQPKKVEDVAAFLTDELAGDDRNVLIAVWPFAEDPYTRVERLDVISGRRVRVSGSPVQRADFTTDHQGEVRFAHGAASDNVNKLYYRSGTNAQWSLVNDESLSRRIETAIGFSEDGALAYLQVQQPTGPDAIVSWSPQTGERREVLRNGVVDPYAIIFRPALACRWARCLPAMHRARGSSMRRGPMLVNTAALRRRSAARCSSHPVPAMAARWWCRRGRAAIPGISTCSTPAQRQPSICSAAANGSTRNLPPPCVRSR